MTAHPLYGEITVTIQGYECILKYAYWHDTDEFTLLRGSYRNDTGEELALVCLDIITGCHEVLILEAIKRSLKNKEAA